MDAKNIHIAIRHIVGIARWSTTETNEWSYIGEKEEFDAEVAQKEIDEFFSESKLYLSVDRHTGHEVSKDKAAWNVQKYVDRDVLLASPDLKKIMEFNHIGIFRRRSVAR